MARDRNSLLVLTDSCMRLHSAGAGHPECPQRLVSIESALRSLPQHHLQWQCPQPCDRKHLELVHEARYVAFIDSLRGQSARLDADTAVCPDSVRAAYVAAGAAVAAVEALGKGHADAALALVRPPGHHAERDRAMGFCLFNNIAVAAAHAIDSLGMKRVMIVDWDVHHGNGTQHIFESRADVLFISTHQYPLWPGTGSADERGRGEGEGFTINCPLPPGFDDAGYVSLFERLVIPVANQYRPELVLVSAGFDAHRDDPLAAMAMTEGGFATLCAMMRDVADRHADGRIALILEGGYNLEALAASVKACAEVLVGSAAPAIDAHLDAAASRVIDRLGSEHRHSWWL